MRFSLDLLLILLFAASATSCEVPQDQAAASGESNSDTTAAESSGWRLVQMENEPTARHESAFVEVDGRFYLIGGRGNHPVDVYDPATNSWSTGPQPPIEIHHFQAVAVDGRIYIVGAWTGGFPDEDGIENVLIYDPAAESWSEGPSIPENRRRGAAGVVVRDGQIYVAAGNRGGHGPHATAVDWFDRFDPASGEWTELPPTPRGRDHFHAAIADDKLYLVGGRNSGVEGFIDSTIAAVDVFDFESGEWTTLQDAPLPTERAGSTTVTSGDRVIITGGEGFGQTWGQTEALDTRTHRWQHIGDLVQPRHGMQGIVHEGRLYVAAGSGGQGGGPELSTMEVYPLSE